MGTSVNTRHLNKILSLLSREDTLLVCSTRGLLIAQSLSAELHARLAHVPSGEPDLEHLASVRLPLSSSIPNAILAIGGGSVIDYAKAIAATTCHVNLVTDLERSNQDALPLRELTLPPIFCIPTTLGSGADVSSAAVLMVQGRKVAISSPGLAPKDSFFLPELISSLGSTHISGALDAIGHAFEGLGSKLLSDELEAYALQTIRIIMELDFSGEWTKKQKADLFVAARLAGKVQELALVGIPHALAHMNPTMAHGLSVGHFLVQFFSQLGYAGHPLYRHIDVLLSRIDLGIPEVLARVATLLENSKEYKSNSFATFSLSQGQIEHISRSLFARACIISIEDSSLAGLSLTRAVEI